MQLFKCSSISYLHRYSQVIRYYPLCCCLPQGPYIQSSYPISKENSIRISIILLHSHTHNCGCWLVCNHISIYFWDDRSFTLLLFWHTHIKDHSPSLSLPNHPLIHHSFSHTLTLLLCIWGKMAKWRLPFYTRLSLFLVLYPSFYWRLLQKASITGLSIRHEGEYHTLYVFTQSFTKVLRSQ